MPVVPAAYIWTDAPTIGFVPACTVTWKEVPETTPVPVSATVCGLPVPLLVSVSVPVRVPVAVGLKMTEIVQVPLAAILAVQPELVSE